MQQTAPAPEGTGSWMGSGVGGHGDQSQHGRGEAWGKWDCIGDTCVAPCNTVLGTQRLKCT